MRCRPSLVRGRAAQVNPGGFTTPARRPSVPHRTAGCGKSSLRPLMAGSSPSLPDGSNPSAAIVQSASDVQCSRLLKTTHTSTFEPNEAVTLSSELTAAGSRCDFREGMPVTTSKNKITRFSASDRQPVRMRFTKKNISSIQWRFLQFSDEARRWLNLRKETSCYVSPRTCFPWSLSSPLGPTYR